MKHLKKFNESLTPDEVDDLKDFCEVNLAYLLDDGYEVDCDTDTATFPEPAGFCAHYEGDTGVIINLCNLDKVRNGEDLINCVNNFKWSEIKDYYIPFLKLLSRRYKLLHFNPFKANKSYDKDETKLICIHGYHYAKWPVWYIKGNSNYYTLNDLINDNISDDTKIYGISVKVVDKI